MTAGGSERQTVFVSPRRSGGGPTLHTDPNCIHIEQAKTVFERRRDAYPDDTSVCRRCSGEATPGGGFKRNPLHARLGGMDPGDLGGEGA